MPDLYNDDLVHQNLDAEQDDSTQKLIDKLLFALLILTVAAASVAAAAFFFPLFLGMAGIALAAAAKGFGIMLGGSVAIGLGMLACGGNERSLGTCLIIGGLIAIAVAAITAWPLLVGLIATIAIGAIVACVFQGGQRLMEKCFAGDDAVDASQEHQAGLPFATIITPPENEPWLRAGVDSSAATPLAVNTGGAVSDPVMMLRAASGVVIEPPESTASELTPVNPNMAVPAGDGGRRP